MTKSQKKRFPCKCGKDYATETSLDKHSKKCNTQISTVTEASSPQIANDAQQLLNQAVAKGADIGTLERLMALRKDMLAEEAKKKFNEAMALFQAECPVIEKTKAVKTNAGQTAYKYAPIESIVKQLKALIQKHGFRYTTTMKLSDTGVKVFCRIVHEMGHEEISEMEVPLGTKTQIMSQSQVVAAASTFAKRYAFLNAFGIMTGDEDNDTADQRKDSPAKPQATAPKQEPVIITYIKAMEDLNEAKTMPRANSIYDTVKQKRTPVWKKNDLDDINVCFINAIARTKNCMKQGDIKNGEVNFVDYDGDTVVGMAEKDSKGFVVLKSPDAKKSPEKKKEAPKTEVVDLEKGEDGVFSADEEEKKKKSRQIHALMNNVKMPNEEYRAFIKETFNVDSSTEMTITQMNLLIQHLKDKENS